MATQNEDGSITPEEDDKVLLLLAPSDCAHVPNALPIDADCGHRCWIAPSAKRMADDPLIQTTTKCIPCGARDPEIRKHVAKQGFVATKQARDELSEMFGVGHVDQIWAQLGVQTLNHPQQKS